MTGCDVEVARRVLCESGVGPLTPIEIEFAELLAGLAHGRWDITTGSFVSSENHQLVDFSRPTWTLSDGLLVRSNEAQGVDSYAARPNV